ncbi:MAG: hypothetical protein DHS80DRAFT_26583 [Piptocephalis tieghemiana]|nr:MAG: hypothetical protein DHS80DRAFT_26583 [Piptocephalis tieghemiana]
MAQDDRPGLVMTCAKPGVFALTYDDGPSEYTKSLLDILDKENVKATFFLLGKAVDDPSTGQWAKVAYDKGHQIAIHTYDHPHINSLSVDEVRSQINRTEQALEKVIGTVPNYFRPPYGECSPTNQQLLEEMGYMIIQWNVDSNDWRYMNDPKKFPLVTTNFKKDLAKMDGNASAAISLQHDIHKFSVDQTLGIIKMIKAKGFAFETVADCLDSNGGGRERGGSR